MYLKYNFTTYQKYTPDVTVYMGDRGMCVPPPFQSCGLMSRSKGTS